MLSNGGCKVLSEGGEAALSLGLKDFVASGSAGRLSVAARSLLKKAILKVRRSHRI